MPPEVSMLEHAPYARDTCPNCGATHPEFLRGQVQRSRFFLGFLWERPYCAIICHECKKIVGWEHPNRYIRPECWFSFYRESRKYMAGTPAWRFWLQYPLAWLKFAWMERTNG